MRIVLATSNPGKAREVTTLLGGEGIEVSWTPSWLGEIESGTTYLENARIKAYSMHRMVQTDVLAEDAGLEVDALNGLPGVHSARFAGPAAESADNMAKVLRLLADIPDERRAGRYRIVAVFVGADGREVIGEGVLEGRIVMEPRGDAGFGYDPIFVPGGEDRTVAEMRADEKNVLSHRGKALRAVLAQLG